MLEYGSGCKKMGECDGVCNLFSIFANMCNENYGIKELC